MRFGGGELRSMFVAATELFEANIQSVNALNVFPVPDGDTGTNMYLTMQAVVEAAEGVQTNSAEDVSAAMARGALMGARGNSGVILSQFFKGLAVGLEGESDFGVTELADALQHAREHAYKAVEKPVEGTLLTVIDRVAAAARDQAVAGATVADMCGAICSAATDAVARTPAMLPVLREAGVVDAGGLGLAILLEGAWISSRGESVVAETIAPPEPIGVEGVTGSVSEVFLEATDEDLYGYCTQFLVEGEGLDPDAIRSKMASMAQSTVVVGDSSMVKAHVHASDPGPVVSYAISLGTLSQVKIENMDAQHQEFAVTRRQEAGGDTPGAPSVSVVAVAWGKGLERLFRSLGATEVMVAGNTMNPSVQEIVEAVDSAPSNEVVFLPNNRNIVPAARQAIQLTQKSLRVVHTTSIPQGIGSILTFNPDGALEDNLRDMEEALVSVRTGEVTTAQRPVSLNGVAVTKGQIIGLLEDSLEAAGDDVTSVLLELLAKAEVSEDDLVTLYWGDLLTEEEADAAMRAVVGAFPGAEVEIVEGGQPHYHFIVSIER